MRIVLIVVLAISSGVSAQRSGDAIWNRIQSIDPATVTAADCEGQVARAATLNGPDLFHGAAICGAANRPVETAFLLNAGQARSIVDMNLIVPATRADSDVTVQLYGFIYSYGGGAGDDAVFRDPALRDRLFRMLDSWSPAFSSDYNPGWNARRRPEAAAYSAAINEVMSGRRQQLGDLSRLYSDQTYYTLHRRLEELSARQSHSFVEGTPEAELANDLQRQMDARAVALGLAHHVSQPAMAEKASRAFLHPRRRRTNCPQRLATIRRSGTASISRNAIRSRPTRGWRVCW